jgi:hypothetical protein
VLVLDEPTTGLDAASEAQVVAGLETLMRGRTTLLVTHSIALARRADRVVVLEGGRIVQDGPPETLLAAGGVFRRLAAHQGLLGSRVPRPPRDPALPQLDALLDPGDAAAVLARTLPPEAAMEDVRPRSVRYKPGRRLVVAYDVVVDGESREAVALADAKADLADRGGVLVQWLPFDLALPVLAEPPARLAARLARLGLAVDAVEARRIGYKPLGRVVLGVGGHVVKGYASDAKHEAAARALRVVARSGAVVTAAYEGSLPELRATVQAALPGTVARDDAGHARAAGELVRGLHSLGVAGLPRARPLAAAAEAGTLVSTLLPELRPRVDALVRRLRDAILVNGVVCSHGDFEAGQLLELDGGGLALLDLDELCAAPAAFDLATYAAHAAPDAAAEVAEAVVDGYGSRPAALAPSLAAALLVRAPAAFRKLEPEWPTRVEERLAAAEEALAA